MSGSLHRSERTHLLLCPHSGLGLLFCLAFQPLGGIHGVIVKDDSQNMFRAQVSYLETVSLPLYLSGSVPTCTVSTWVNGSLARD